MAEYPATEDFDARPALPTTIGPWSVTSAEYTLTRWEHSTESVALELVQSGRRSGHTFTTRYFEIEYQSADGDIWTVATDVPTTFAYQLAAHILRTVKAPVTALTDATDCLNELSGIGPIRSRELVALGVTDREALRAAARAASGECPHPVNRYHSDAVVKRTTAETLSLD